MRTNSLSDVIEETLLDFNMPYHISGGSSFFQRKEIKDLIAYLKLIVNREDEISLLRVINMPRRGIGIKSIEHIRALSKQLRCTFYNAMRVIATSDNPPGNWTDRIKRSCLEFTDLIDTFTQKFEEKKGIASITLDLVTDINYWGYLQSEHSDNENIAKFKYGNITRFMDMMDRWEKNPENKDPDIARYLTRITLITSDDDKNDDNPQGKINLMTIHASKGLEFDTVFIAGVEDHIIPHERSIEEDIKNLEEERRLFYVAITRARRKLYISSCQTRRRNQSTQISIPSRFLDEIPQELLVELSETKKEVSDQDANDFFNNMAALFGQK